MHPVNNGVGLKFPLDFVGTHTKQKGGDLEDFINANDLVVLNDGLRPTWSQNNKTSYIDITVINRYAAENFMGKIGRYRRVKVFLTINSSPSTSSPLC